MGQRKEAPTDAGPARWKQFVPAAVTVVLGTVLSLAAYALLIDLAQRHIRSEFTMAANNRFASIKESLEAHLERLGAFRNVYAASTQPGREEFRQLSRLLLEAEPEVQAVEWVPRVPDADRQAYEEAARREGLPGFEFIATSAEGTRGRAPKRAEYFPVYFVEPREESEAVLGYDLASVPDRLEALNRARDTGRTIVTSGLRPGEGPEGGYSFLAHLPVYAAQSVPETVEARREALRGFVVGTLRAQNVVEHGISHLHPHGADAGVYDEEAPAGRRLLYSHPSRIRDTTGAIRADPVAGDLPPQRHTFELGGRRWSVVSTAMPGSVLLHEPQAPYPAIVLGGGLTFTAMIAAYFLTGIGRARRTERLVVERTCELHERERQLRRAGERLEELVGERTADLKAANEELEREVDERARTEQTLRVRDRAISCVEDAIIVSDHRGPGDNPLIYANPAFEQITGYTVAECLGRDCRFLQGDDRDQPGLGEIRAALQEGRGCRVLLRNYRKDGSMFWNDLSLAPVQDASSKVTHYAAIMADVTEQRQAEQEIREARQKYETLVQNIPQAVYSVLAGPPPTLAFVSERIKEWTGLSPQAFYDDPDAWPQCIHPDDRDRVLRCLDEAAGEGHGIVCEYRVVHRQTGEVRHIVEHTTAIKDDTGRIVRFDGTLTDVTDQRRAEEERRRLEAQVQHAQKLESLGVLAGGIAHDFNNMLVAILGNADLALMEIGEFSPARRSVEEIKRASIRASELTNQMLAYSGRGRFVVERVDINALIEEMGQLLNVSISKQADLAFDLAQGLPRVEADVTQIRQVVLNLITNASDAVGDAGGEITVRTRLMDADRAYLSDTYVGEDLPEGRYVLMEVADTGCGMDEETREKIFDPFFSTKFTGRGLGLAAVLGIVRGHKGAIRVRSRPGEGTTFSILLPSAVPMAQAEVTGEAPAAQAPSPTVGSILVIDDEDAVREVAAAMLERSGLEVLTAANGREGVDVFSQHADEIAAVLLDLTMPVMGGEEASRRIRAIRPDVPIILCSGYGEQEATQRFAGQSLAGFLQKPFELNTLLARLGMVLQKA